MELDSKSSKFTISTIDKIAAELKQAPAKAHQQGEYKSKKEIMFSILYSWRQSDPSASMPRLAKVFLRCELADIAVRLDPSCKSI